MKKSAIILVTAIALGAAMLTPANLLPPAGSESERRFTGTAIGSDATGMPLAS